jgi:hypothetical protein
MSFSVNHANSLLPKIIMKNKEFTDRILNKMKGHEIFNDIDLKFSSNLKKIISLSEKRRQNIKTGTLLKNVIDKNIIQSNELSSEIINHSSYRNINNLLKERKKLKKVSSEPILKDVRILINDLINSKNTFKIDLNRRKKLYEAEQVINPFDNLTNKEKLFKNKELINNKLTEDHKVLNNSVNIYLNQMNDIYNNYEEKVKKKEMSINQIQKAIDLEKKKVKFPLKKSELLYYQKKKEDKKIKTKKIIIDKFKININKILSFSKNGINSKKTNDSNCINENQNSLFLSPINIISNDLHINHRDYENTPKLVYKQALRNYNIKENFEEKNKCISNIIDLNLPSFEEYNRIIKSKITAFRLNNYNKNNEEKYIETNKSEDEKEINNDENNFELIKRKKIKEEIKNLIEGARKNNNEEKLEDNENNNLKREYDLINLVPERKINKFTDEYSFRENFNKLLKNIHTLIKHKSIKKNVLEQIINNFYFEMEEENKQKEKELSNLCLKQNKEKGLNVHQRKIQKNLKKIDFLNNSTIESNNNSILNYSKRSNEQSILSSDTNYKKNNILNHNYEIVDTTIKINKIPKDLKNQFYYKEFLEHKKKVEKKSNS